MPRRRESETDDTREWVGDVAAANDLDEMRDWVVWGVSTPPERAADPTAVPERPGEPGNDIARQIAEGYDQEWAESRDMGKWIVIRRALEDEVDEWTWTMRRYGATRPTWRIVRMPRPSRNCFAASSVAMSSDGESQSGSMRLDPRE